MDRNTPGQDTTAGKAHPDSSPGGECSVWLVVPGRRRPGIRCVEIQRQRADQQWSTLRSSPGDLSTKGTALQGLQVIMAHMCGPFVPFLASGLQWLVDSLGMNRPMVLSSARRSHG